MALEFGMNEMAAMLIGVFISFTLEASPKVNVWWNSMTSMKRGYVTTMLVVVASVAMTWLDCYSQGSCPSDWPTYLATAILYIASGNTLAYKGVSKPYRKYRTDREKSDED